MKKAKGEVKNLLGVIGQLQDLVGSAHGSHMNDQDQHGFEKAQKQLQKAHDLCIEATAPYDPCSY